MLKKYSELIAPSEESKIGPSEKMILSLLNYSKSLEVKKLKKERILVQLN